MDSNASTTSTVAAVPKRKTIIAACQFCRSKKLKCDDSRPCDQCSARHRECTYFTAANETRQQSVKRKYEEVNQAFHENNNLIRALMSSTGTHAHAALDLLRAGHSPAEIVSQMQGSPGRDTVSFTYEQRLQRKALICICQSSCGLEDLLFLAPLVLSSTTRMETLGPASDMLRNRIINLELLTGIVASRHGSSTHLRDIHEPSDAHYLYVPADPWTGMTSSDETVSLLVTVFLRFANGYWRFVEEDLFLRAMRSRKMANEYCSPLLVNAICAWASLYTEIPETFKMPGHYATGGQIFYDEAMRLWELERDRSSMTNVSALLIMACDSSVRGKDASAPVLCKAAVKNLQRLREVDTSNMTGRIASDYMRARESLAGSVLWEELGITTHQMGHLDCVTMKTEHLPRLEQLPDRLSYWSGYPYTTVPMPFRANVLMRERQNMSVFNAELFRIVAPGTQHTPTDIIRLTQDLGQRMAAWHHGLHVDLRARKVMPAPMFEFHAEYCSHLIHLYHRAWIKVFGDSGSHAFEDISEADSTDEEEDRILREHAREEFLPLALEGAYRGATLVQDYRRLYGLKVCVPHVMMHSAENVFFLLRQLPRNDKHSQSQASTPLISDAAPIDNPTIAFVECFRVLLGAGVQMMLPRAMTRMVFHTAMQLNIRLPEPVERMLQLFNQTSWNVSDLEMIDSVQPNLALIVEPYIAGNRKAVEMGRLLRQ